VLRDQVRRAVETLIEGRDEDVKGALHELEDALEPHPEFRKRFQQLRVVEDARSFLGES